MNKELFVSSTPHETKVGLVEDDLLAEIYLERENEYTLAGSIYKGRLTRVLPGMQSAFVDIGLERDAFLYVSDFMELEDQDEDLTDVPAGRGPREMRPQPVRVEAHPVVSEPAGELPETGGDFEHQTPDAMRSTEAPPTSESSGAASAAAETGNLSDQSRERGGWRGRRRRRGRRDGRDRGPEPRPFRSAAE